MKNIKVLVPDLFLRVIGKNVPKNPTGALPIIEADPLELTKRGGEGSGNYDHAGRPGKVGGSAPRSAGDGVGGGSAQPAHVGKISQGLRGQLKLDIISADDPDIDPLEDLGNSLKSDGWGDKEARTIAEDILEVTQPSDLQVREYVKETYMNAVEDELQYAIDDEADAINRYSIQNFHKYLSVTDEEYQQMGKEEVDKIVRKKTLERFKKYIADPESEGHGFYEEFKDLELDEDTQSLRLAVVKVLDKDIIKNKKEYRQEYLESLLSQGKVGGLPEESVLFFGYRNEDGEIASIAMTSPQPFMFRSSLHQEYLAKFHPDLNTPETINAEYLNVDGLASRWKKRGYGTEVMLNILKYAADRNMGITGEALDSAASYYDLLGAHDLDTKEGGYAFWTPQEVAIAASAFDLVSESLGDLLNIPDPAAIFGRPKRVKEETRDPQYNVDEYALERAVAKKLVERGGTGSGNYDHAGRPGKVGGSAPRSGSAGDGVGGGRKEVSRDSERFSIEIVELEDGNLRVGKTIIRDDPEGTPVDSQMKLWVAEYFSKYPDFARDQVRSIYLSSSPGKEMSIRGEGFRQSGSANLFTGAINMYNIAYKDKSELRFYRLGTLSHEIGHHLENDWKHRSASDLRRVWREHPEWFNEYPEIKDEFIEEVQSGAPLSFAWKRFMDGWRSGEDGISDYSEAWAKEGKYNETIAELSKVYFQGVHKGDFEIGKEAVQFIGELKEAPDVAGGFLDAMEWYENEWKPVY